MLQLRYLMPMALLLACNGTDTAGFDSAAEDANLGDGTVRDAADDANLADGTTHDFLTCPTEPVTNGSVCDTEGHLCAWLGCPEGTTLRAECDGKNWSVTDLGCEPRSCGDVVNDMECAADQLCVIRSGGAYLTNCSLGACTDGVIDEACACEHCGSNPCAFRGLSVECNTCPNGQCP